MSVVDVIVPAWNEEKTLGSVLTCLQEAQKERVIRRIVVVDDGSTDGSVSLVRKMGLSVVALRRNRGKAGAFAAGVFRLAKDPPELVLMLDADLVPFSPAQLRILIEPFERNRNLDMAISNLSEASFTKWSGQRCIRFSALHPLILRRPKWLQYFGLGPHQVESRSTGLGLETALNILVGKTDADLRQRTRFFTTVDARLVDHLRTQLSLRERRMTEILLPRQVQSGRAAEADKHWFNRRNRKRVKK